MIVWTCLLSSAIADDGREGVLLPGATPIEALHGSVGVGAGVYATWTEYGTMSGGQAAFGITDRLSIVGVATRHWLERDSGDDDGAFGWSLVSLRALVVQQDAVNVAVMLTQQGYWGRPYEGALGLGLAIELGSQKVRWDATVPSIAALQAAVVEGDYQLRPAFLLGGAETGLTVVFNDHHRLRFGLPGLTYGIRAKHLYVDASVAFPVVFVGASLQAGVRF